ncbi:MAG: acyl-CoA dehydrogenase family protein [Pseudomonadales bacterium]|jgi:alkylation response protein AidB-like acyl-CoA dehydrogenase|nr:acyl-CoA dehydrogenase family protein [Pseudomonadales bacterium]MDP6472198.1 acyl-CoA dehydrogenase family protein [Pseudomonadales bacterium]MDP6826550.1 acyl-CoA dehydrogenase family protein [Pseudomonadales bacterium]MDP6970358.1 acyl-CoA dehydrogenase family protein [Pseudomonadales bacterium]|tara:strand:+ start:5042 stop:6247 length:1206 start_codon:yes stop_codon:yes gene_type:complete
MNITLSPEAELFRKEVLHFLDTQLTDELRRAANLTTGVHSHIEASRRWYKILASKGWLATTWPEEFGGAGWTALQRHIFGIEACKAGAPLLFNMGIRHLGPVLMAHGTREQQETYLPAILSGDHVWCQGYSEPSAGSDLASLRMRAVRNGDRYVLNGSKIWITGAQYATHIFCLVRTSDTGRKQEGISFVIVPMDTPGITVQPIITLAGEHEVNQVFFSDVSVPIANRVGEENNGWRVAKVLMAYTRSNNVNTSWVREQLEQLKRLCAGTSATGAPPPIANHHIAAQLANLEIQLQASETMELRLLSEMPGDQSPGALSSLLKTRGSELKQSLTQLFIEVAGYHGLPQQLEVLDPYSGIDGFGPPEFLTAMPRYLNERAATIYSGASEIQRNLLAKRVLGL